MILRREHCFQGPFRVDCLFTDQNYVRYEVRVETALVYSEISMPGVRDCLDATGRAAVKNRVDPDVLRRLRQASEPFLVRQPWGYQPKGYRPRVKPQGRPRIVASTPSRPRVRSGAGRL